MPLLDHFHPPLSVKRRWESLHATWTVCLADALTPLLPEGYFVEVQTHAGAGIEIDVAAFEERRANGQSPPEGAVTAPTWTAPPAVWSMPAVFPASFEVRILSTASGPTLAAAIELVSPANKDRPDSRRAFASKCASYLYQGVALLIVDVVTERTANLHNETLRLMESAERYLLPAETSLYAVAYHPLRRGSSEEIDIWPAACEIGSPLPTLPLFVNADFSMAVPLEETYAEACRRRRLS